VSEPDPRLSLQDGGTLRDFITRIEQGIYIVTPDGRVVDANPALLKIFRADSLEQLQQHRSEDLVADATVLAERRALLDEHGWIRDFTYEIRCLDGTRRSVRDTVFAQRDSEGRIESLHGILDPIEADEELPLDLPLSAFFTGAPAGLAILDNELRFVRINHRLADMHLLSVDEHIGRPLALVLPGLTPVLEPILRHVLETGTPAVNVEIGTEDPRSPNEPLTWRLSVFPLGPVQEAPTGVGVVAIDITDTKRLEEQARLDGRYLTALIEGSPLAMVTLDAASRVVAANAAFERLFRVSREQAIGRDLDELVAPPDHLEEARGLTQRTQRGENLRVDASRRRADGSSVQVRVHSAPIVVDGQHVGAHVIYEEI